MLQRVVGLLVVAVSCRYICRRACRRTKPGKGGRSSTRRWISLSVRLLVQEELKAKFSSYGLALRRLKQGALKVQTERTALKFD